MNQKETIQALENGAFDEKLQKLYACGKDDLAPYRKRIADAVIAFGNEFGEDGDVALFSAPGRTELCGNHTDHQGGHVLAASIDLDIIAVAAVRENEKIRLKSEGFLMNSVQLSDLSAQPDEVGTSAALLRGIAAKFAEKGHPVTGFDAYTTSNVRCGSGLSSSAAFEALVGKICSVFFAQDSMDAVEIAQIGQYAENMYFGKPCGLMDQMACTVGGVIAIDFKESTPVVSRTEVDLTKEGYALCILDSGADHADLTEAYAAIPAEMHAVANVLGHERLSQARCSELLRKLPEVRQTCGDRAALRALHYFADDDHVMRAVNSLRNGYFKQYLEEIQASGRSSIAYLQNVSTFTDPRHEEVALTIALCETLLGGRGAVRVHGGGFAGTVQAYVPLDMLRDFRRKTEAVLGAGQCHVLRIRNEGVVQINGLSS